MVAAGPPAAVWSRENAWRAETGVTVDAEQWSVLEMVLGTDLLARVCGRFDDGRSDDRLRYLTDLVARLRRTHDAAGVREWLATEQPAAGGATPASVLAGDWDPDAEGPQRLRASLPPVRVG